LNAIFFAIVLIAFVVAALRQVAWSPENAEAVSPMELLTTGAVEAAGGAVTLAIGLVGVMALFLGLMKVAEAGGLLVIIAKTVRPLMVRLFPDVPPDHPAMGAMILNISANALGLGNAATPFGIRAMQELDKLNPQKGTATNAMALFLAINTSSVTLLPTGVVALRASVGSADPAGIVPTTLFATICSTAVAIVAAKLLQRVWTAPAGTAPNLDEAPAPAVRPDGEGEPQAVAEGASEAYPLWVSALVLGGIAALVPLTILYGKAIAPWVIPVLIVGLLGFGVARRVAIYEVFVEGAKDGFQVALRIIPYLVAILVAVGMFRASGAMDTFVGFDHQRPDGRAGQLHRLSGLHPAGLDRDHLLRPGGLFRGGTDPAHPPCAGRRTDGRPDRHRRGRGDLFAALCRLTRGTAGVGALVGAIPRNGGPTPPGSPSPSRQRRRRFFVLRGRPARAWPWS
jgi:spore maturation protein SpmA